MFGFIKFAIVGGCGFITNITTFYLLSTFGVYYIVNSIICFLIAVTQNYILNSFFTFNGQILTLKKYVFYIGANIVGLSINLSILFVCRNFVFNDFDKRDLISQATGIFGAMIVNFLLSKYIIFRRRCNE